MFQRIDTDGVGRHLAAGFPARLAGEARDEVRPAPLLGQHTDEILADVLGLSGATIARLHDKRVVAGPAKEMVHA